DVLKSLPESPKGFKWQQGRDPSKEVTPAQLAATELARGDYDAALDKTKGVETPDAAAVRGEARWQRYYKQQLAKNLPLNLEAVAPAIEDLKAGNAEARVKQIEEIINTDNALRKNATALQEAEIALRASLAKIDPKLAKADAKTLANAMGQLVAE